LEGKGGLLVRLAGRPLPARDRVFAEVPEAPALEDAVSRLASHLLKLSSLTRQESPSRQPPASRMSLHAVLGPHCMRRCTSAGVSAITTTSRGLGPRSEEHTSELQSRENP